MTPRQVADVAVARLGLPVPMAKLVTVQALGAAIGQEGGDALDALVSWLESRELESQCLEALCPLLAMEPAPSAALVTRMRGAITRPSLASDLMLSLATGNPLLVPSWRGGHSGPVPQLMDLSREKTELHNSTFVPPLFQHQLSELQEKMRRPLLRQWAFEYSMILKRCGDRSDGYLSYFLDMERSNVGHFVAHSGHMARSAYLRALACAADHWGLPLEVAQHYARFAFPAEPIFLRLAPQEPPLWAEYAHGHTTAEAADAQVLVRSIVQHAEAQLQQRIMHCALTVVDEPECHVDLELFAVARAADEIDSEDVMTFYRWLLGEATPSRDGVRAFLSPPVTRADFETMGFVPLVVPLLGPIVGYLQTDFLGRVPYIPVSTVGVPELELVPLARGGLLQSQHNTVGQWGWWLWNWKPSHRPNFARPIACCASLQASVAQQLAQDQGASLEQVWQLTTWRRDPKSTQWNETREMGVLRP